MDKWKLSLAFLGIVLIVGAVLLVVFSDIFRIVYAVCSALIGLVLMLTVARALIIENKKKKNK